MEVILKLFFYMLCILLPLHMLMTYEFHRWERSIRRRGVVIHRFEALDEASEVIGSYCGAEIHRTVTFGGMHYEFFGVASPAKRGALRQDELYLDPGLLYVSRDES